MAVSATAMTAIVPAWTGSETTRSTWSVIEPTMLSAMIGMPDGAQLVGRHADVAAHDRAGQDQEPSARQVGDGPDGRRDVLLADERDGVDADPLAAQVVPVGLADRAERDLGDLRAAADDDDPLAEHAIERPGQVDRADVVDRLERRDEAVLGDALDLELDLGERRVALDPADRGQRPDPTRRCAATRSATAVMASARSTTSNRIAAVGLGASRRAASASEPRPAAPGPEVVDRERVRLHRRRSGRAPRTAGPSAAKASRVAAASEVVSISAPSVSSATPTMPVMLTPRSPAPWRRARASPADRRA